MPGAGGHSVTPAIRRSTFIVGWVGLPRNRATLPAGFARGSSIWRKRVGARFKWADNLDRRDMDPMPHSICLGVQTTMPELGLSHRLGPQAMTGPPGWCMDHH